MTHWIRDTRGSSAWPGSSARVDDMGASIPVAMESHSTGIRRGTTRRLAAIPVRDTVKNDHAIIGTVITCDASVTAQAELKKRGRFCRRARMPG